MKTRSLILVIFISLLIWVPSSVGQENWTEKKLGQVILKTEKAAAQKRWPRAIKYGEHMITGSLALGKTSDPRHINLLRNVNNYYDKAGRLNEVGPRVKLTYKLAIENLGLDHPTARKSRTLYYKLLIANKRYYDAIPLMQQTIAISKKNPKSIYKTHQYLTRLYSLYSLTDQYEMEAEILGELLDLNIKLFGKRDENNVKIIMDLARSYCRQGKIQKFDQLLKTYHLKYVC